MLSKDVFIIYNKKKKHFKFAIRYAVRRQIYCIFDTAIYRYPILRYAVPIKPERNKCIARLTRHDTKILFRAGDMLAVLDLTKNYRFCMTIKESSERITATFKSLVCS